MELKDLASFVVLAEELHFGRAAARLHISAPPLTQRIKQLENELGVVLFERNNRRVELAPAGALLLEEARSILDRTRQIRQRLQAVELGYAGRLRIGVSGSVIHSDARRRLEAAIPAGIDASWAMMSSAEQVKAIRERQLDMGVVNTPIDHDGLAVHVLEHEPFVVAVPATHRFAARKSIRLSMLRDDTFIIGERHLGPNYYDRMISACERAGFVPKVDLQSQLLSSYIGLVALGAGVTFAPRSLARAGLAGIAYLRIREQAPHAEVSLAWSAQRTSPVTDRVLSGMRIARGP
ncbi:LysR family transcriptional regulator [Pigmentiphaga soli]|uniref:LysR family transcriptional regulator n=1 Tax=Pigmentiphaga soli TaxID=1007095 RepID=A0ABP8HSB0_9BURK